VVCRENPNGAWAKSRRQRPVPLDFLVVQADIARYTVAQVPAHRLNLTASPVDHQIRQQGRRPGDHPADP
jgi:hypothetical protein